MIKLTLGATLPTGRDYENVEPTVEIEAETFEEALTMGLRHLEAVANRVQKSPLRVHPASQANLERLIDVDGEVVLFDRERHSYQDSQGNRLLSGSTFSHKFVKEFPKEQVSKVIAKKHAVPVDEILAMWATNAEASTSLGTAIHAALELYGKYRDIAKITKGDSSAAIHKNPFLDLVVTKFYENRQEEFAEYELFVTYSGLCGFIDRLLVLDEKKKIARVQDYKTNPDIAKPETILPPFAGLIDNTTLGAYWLQLSFYAYILQRKGWTIEGLDIFNIVPVNENGKLDIKITHYQHEVIDVTGGL